MKTLLVRKRVFLSLALLLSIMKVPVSLARTEFPANHGEDKELHNPSFILIEALSCTIQNHFLTEKEYRETIRNFSLIMPFPRVLPTEEQHIGALRRLFQNHTISNF